MPPPSADEEVAAMPPVMAINDKSFTMVLVPIIDIS
jgi:hypothetical protein